MERLPSEQDLTLLSSLRHRNRSSSRKTSKRRNEQKEDKALGDRRRHHHRRRRSDDSGRKSKRRSQSNSSSSSSHSSLSLKVRSKKHRRRRESSNSGDRDSVSPRRRHKSRKRSRSNDRDDLRMDDQVGCVSDQNPKRRRRRRDSNRSGMTSRRSPRRDDRVGRYDYDVDSPRHRGDGYRRRRRQEEDERRDQLQRYGDRRRRSSSLLSCRRQRDRRGRRDEHRFYRRRRSYSWSGDRHHLRDDPYECHRQDQRRRRREQNLHRQDPPQHGVRAAGVVSDDDDPDDTLSNLKHGPGKDMHTSDRGNESNTAKKNRQSSPSKHDDSVGHYNGSRGSVIAERYRVVAEVGIGTFGRVLECKDLTGRHTDVVAIKVVRNVKRYHESAVIEADIIRNINRQGGRGTSHCVIMYEAFSFRGHFCMVFESLGPSLYDYLKQRDYKPFPVECVRHFAKQLLETLEFLHSLKVIHTDLKLENLLLLSDREVCYCGGQMIPEQTYIKVIDFGGATYDHEKKSAIVNTRQYRAPEVILGCGWSMPSDLWSLGKGNHSDYGVFMRRSVASFDWDTDLFFPSLICRMHLGRAVSR